MIKTTSLQVSTVTRKNILTLPHPPLSPILKTVIYKVVIFGSFVPALCSRTSCAQVYEFPQSRFGDKQDGTLFS